MRHFSAETLKMAHVLPINDEHKSRTVDADEKNKFKFDWLAKKVKVAVANEEFEVLVGESIKKVAVSGKVMCSLCSDFVYYGKRGFVAISDHIKSKKHSSKENLKRKNYSLSSAFFSRPTNNESESSLLNTVNSNVTTSPLQKLQVNVPLCDRVCNMQALVLGVIAEHNLSFSMAPVLIDVAKTLASDKKALANLSMARTTASYKMNLGLAKTFLDETVNNMINNKFSLNIDEATSKNSLRVLCVLVSYFSPLQKKVVVEHLSSVSVVKVTAVALHETIKSLFHKFAIPWENLMSLLMDSCNVMRGSKNGLEKRLRENEAPHLLDIDGDSCHHIHNSCKRFCKPFDGWVESYLNDVHNDFKWSVDMQEYLAEICLILGLKYTAVDKMAMHRWLSSYDITMHNLRLLDALIVVYYAFLPSREKETYYPILSAIYHKRNVTLAGRQKIKSIQNDLSSKTLTSDGKKRKERIVKKILYEREKTMLIMNFYISVLPLLKKYVCLFQTKEPLIHQLHNEQKQLFLDFLACFVKQEIVADKPVKELLDLDVAADGNRLEKKKMFLGMGTESLISKMSNTVVVDEFLEKAMEAYISCAQYMQKTLPLNSLLLKCISAIDPRYRGHHITLNRLKQLPSLVRNVLTEDDLQQYALEVHQYQVDKQLRSPVIDDNGKMERIDVWWSDVFNMPKYSALSKMVKSLLSCFHGPQVESAFSMMGNIIDEKSGNMNIETHSAIQVVKHKLLSSEKSAVDYFKKSDHLHEPVDSNLCRSLRNSYKLHKEYLEEKKSAAAIKKQKLSNPALVSLSKQQFKKSTEEKERNARIAHARKRKLEIMVKKIKEKKSRMK